MLNTFFCRLGLCFAFVFLQYTCPADLVTGRILCDANQSQSIDAGDLGMAGVMVVVVSEAGGFSNSAVTVADGSFNLTIPNFDASAYRRDPLSQSYVESLVPGTLPTDAMVLFPQPALGTNPVYYITPATTNAPLYYISLSGPSTNGDWLISSVACQGSIQTNVCRLSGSGAIRDASNKVEHSFSGSISPKIKKNGFRQGNWTHQALALNLLFKSTEIDAVTCAQGTGSNTNLTGVSEAANAIEFTGRGTLRPLRGKKRVTTPVFFTVFAEDLGKPGAGTDAYYIRVYDQNGITLLIVSGDPANPENIVPVPISKGNLRIRPAKL